MKMPELIKKGLDCCNARWAATHFVSCKSDCPYWGEGVWCKNVMHSDVIAYIRQLESSLAQVERENKAMLYDMARYTMCGSCKHFSDREKCPQQDECVYGKIGHFEWRGVCAENTEDDGNA